MKAKTTRLPPTARQLLRMEGLIIGRDALLFHSDHKIPVPVALIELRWHVATESWLAVVQVTMTVRDYPVNELLTVPVVKLSRR